jgi:adenylate cyclase
MPKMSGKASPEALLATYLGRDVARRVLSGETSRGQGRRVRAAIFFADLNGFTALTGRLPAEQVIAHLNDYFDIVATSVLKHNGEVLKFIGDGLLAAFNIDGKNPASACCQALHAGLDAIEGLTRANQRRELPLEAGVALHYGDVVYGNIGCEARLDFTVIGAAVNEATRIEALCQTLSRPLLISAEFAKVCTCHPLASLGHYRLRGVAHPQEIFTAAPKAA